MKKVFYLLAVVTTVAFSACNPLDKTYKQLGDLPAPTAKAVTANLTLTAADYALAPKGSYASKGFSFKSIDSAKLQIPVILAAKYPTYGEKSTITVTYANAPASLKVADSLYNNVAYTVVNPTDYTNSSAVTGTTFKDWSAAQVLLYLTYKYPTPVANQLSVLTYLYYESGVTPSSGVLTTDSFVFLNGVWTKIYTISAAQYTAAGRGNYGNFTSGDVVNLPSIFNNFLKADVNVAATAKAGDVKYVSYKYFASSTNYQRVVTLTFDGANWVTTATAATPIAFLKTNGVWVADNTVNYTLASADYKYMGQNTTAGSVAGRANIVQYPDFNVSASTDATYWSDTDIQGALITFLQYAYPKAVANQNFNITYLQYFKGVTSNVTKTFQFDGSKFVFVK